MEEQKRNFKPGDKFNQLTILAIYKEKLKPPRCSAVCECGKVKEFALKDVTGNKTKSCGCLVGSRFKPGDEFNRLTIIEIHKKEKLKPLRCSAICKCGRVKEYSLKAVTNSQVKSCGCLIKDRPKKPRKRRPPKVSPNAKEKRSWAKMKQRCYYPAHRAYKYYGERGIVVCDEWRNSFKQFFEDMGKAPTRQHSIDRIDNNGNYCKENCRWATPIEQNQNRRDSRFVTLLGETHTISYWARLTGNRDDRIRDRLNHGWSPAEAVLIPQGETIRAVRNADILEALL